MILVRKLGSVERPKRSYRFLFGKEKYADLYEDEITSIQLIDPNIRKGIIILNIFWNHNQDITK